MASIPKKLQQWLDAGLISADQHSALTRFEAENGTSRNWWIPVMLLGVAVMGLGVISLIAANWATIPAILKVLLAFLLLSVLALVMWWLDNQKKPIGFEVALTGFLIGCLAMLGLLGQVFHLNGQWFHALLAWGIITLPLILFAQHFPARFLWVTLTLTGITFSLLAWDTKNLEVESGWFIAPLVGFLIAVIAHHLTQLLPILTNLRSSCFFWVQFSGIMTLLFADIIHSIGEMGLLAYYPYYLLLGLAVIVAVGILFNKNYQVLNKILLLSALVLLLLYYHPTLLFSGETSLNYWFGTANSASWLADDVRAPILTLTILGLYAIHVGNSGFTTSFNLITILIGLRFLILYFQAIGGLAATGFGLIVSGALIILVAWMWQKYRKSLQRWTQELGA